MTTTATEHGAERPNAALPNIVLTLNCDTAQDYLRNNEVLDALNAQVHKIDVEIDFSYLDPDIAFDHPDRMIELLEKHPSRTLPKLRELLGDPGWRRGRIREVIVDTIRADLEKNFSDVPWKTWPPSIRAIVLLESMLGRATDIRDMLEWQFPSAQFFSVSSPRAKPERIWETPLCDSCGTESSRAGDCFVCEGCGGIVPPRPSDL